MKQRYRVKFWQMYQEGGPELLDGSWESLECAELRGLLLRQEYPETIYSHEVVSEASPDNETGEQ